ncbi:MAG: chromosome segregation protein SMC [Desulfatibacillaceae bacterium]|nr:chromosome segregation protein SMC [Desulfatibacillaceae bacterium]
MRLKKLDICGFKSFPEKTTIHFTEGISAIVGPNGCGKSNIVDAICWVTGEQSVKNLRGKAMEDVIFAGASNKPSMNMAEVSITFANNNGSTPEQYSKFSEIQITRKLFRSGESGYFINKQPCRLKDITHLLAGSGVGARAYSVIQQGNIGAITEAGPEERRVFIEEAAGVTRYKARKKEAQLKIKSTTQNLLRVKDIILEVERNLESTRRQARKAEHYKLLAQKALGLETALCAYEFDRYAARIATLEAKKLELNDLSLSRQTLLAQISARAAELSQQLARLNDELSAAKDNLHALTRNTDRMESELAHKKSEKLRLEQEADALARQRDALEQKQAQIAQEKQGILKDRDDARARFAEAGETIIQAQAGVRRAKEKHNELAVALEGKKKRYMNLAADQARYDSNLQSASTSKAQIRRQIRIKGEEAELARQRIELARQALEKAGEKVVAVEARRAEVEEKIVGVEGRLEEVRLNLKAQVALVHGLDLERGRLKSQLSTLKRMEQNYEWFKDGVKTILKERDAAAGQDRPDTSSWGAKVSGLVAELIEPHPGYEQAVEAALGPALEFVVMEDCQAGLAAMEHLAASGGGRAGFIPKPWAQSFAAQAKKEPNSLLAHVNVAPGCQSLAESLLGGVFVAQSRQQALEMHQKGINGHLLVTQDGGFLATGLYLTGGAAESRPGILAQKGKIKELASRLEKIEADLADGRAKQSALEQDMRSLDNELTRLVEMRRSLGSEEIGAQKALSQAREEDKLARRHHEILVLEQDQLAGDEDDADREMAKYKDLIAQVEAEAASARDELESLTGQMASTQALLDENNEFLMDAKLTQSSIGARLESLEASLKMLAQYEKDETGRFVELDDGIRLKTQQAAQAFDQSVALEQSLVKAYEELEKLKAGLESRNSLRSAMEGELNQHQAQAAGIAGDRESLARKLRELDIELSQACIRQESVVQRALDKFARPLDALRREEGFTLLADDEQAAGAAKDLEEIKAKQARIGDVNLGAIEEYEALKERHDFLCAQRDDLLGAIEALEKVIRKINRYTQKRFVETLEQVNQKLLEVFPRLFSGGEARLEMTEPDKPLETGVEYHVHPPGKKLTRMSLLSGGEKALAAIAFVFAIFLLKPSSFCLMDEVDAPLDDSNVFRFNQLLKLIGQQSQVVMITHNKSAMEFADILFGVTMETKGVSKLVSVSLDKSDASPALN